MDSPAALPVTAVALDAKGYSSHSGLVHLEWRRGIREIFSGAWRCIGVAPTSLAVQDTGDGVLALIPADVAKAVVVADFVRELDIALSQFNIVRGTQARMQLRVALHHGDAIIDGDGFVDEAAITVSRLVASDQVREALDTSPDAAIALIISDEIFRGTVAKRYRGLDPRDFRRVEVNTPKFRGRAWIRVLGSDIEPSPPPAGEWSSHRTGGRGGRVVDTGVVQEVAGCLWRHVVAVPAHRADAAGTSELFRRGKTLLARIGARRRRAGLDASPGDIDELADELSRLVADEPDAENEVADFYRRTPGDVVVTQRDHSVSTIVYGDVRGGDINFGVKRG